MSSSDQHVVPENDTFEHNTSVEKGRNCHCNPNIVMEGSGAIVVHNAYDNRELFEDIKEIVN